MSAELLVIRNGTIYDGTGAPPYEGSVLIRGDRVVEVTRGVPPEGTRSFDASGLAVAPGIIDMHTHSDVSVLSDIDCVSAVGQGITTQVVGQCGFSAAPTDDRTRRSLKDEEPVFGFPGGPGYSSGEWGWNTIHEYLAVIRAASPRTNVATLVGHNTIRRLAVGSDDRAVNPADVGRMVELVQGSIEGGAFGVSTGLSYAPGLFATIDELVALAGVAGRLGHRYHTHMRYGELSVRESLAEAIETGRRSGAPVNVSHLYPTRYDEPGEAEQLLEMIDQANADGIDVTFDLTLFPRGGGAWLQTLPSWAREGGLNATVARMRDPAVKGRLLEHVRRRYVDRDWDDVLIVKVNQVENSSLVGRSIGAVARERGVEPAEAALSLVEEDGQFWVAPTIKRQSDLDVLLRHPLCVPVTDGMSAHPVRHSHLGLMPKTFGTFPYLFGTYVRERRVLSLADAVARVTSLPAKRLGLRDRGQLAEGQRSDLLVFDPEAVGNRATDERPGRAPSGIIGVMVNGEWAFLDGKLTDTRSGQAIAS